MRRSWHSCQPLDLHRMAREYFLAAKRIELQKLARELGISRATAYRWAGSAEQLVGEVVASLVDDTFETLCEETEDLEGSERVCKVLEGLLHHAMEFTALKRFLKRNPEQGLKVLASDEGPVQSRTIDNIEQLLSEEVEAGNLALSVQPAFMAYALTRLLESFLYSDVITDTEPDPERVGETIELMLGQAVVEP